MKAHLMFKNQDFDTSTALSPEHRDLLSDLGLEILMSAMAQGDDVVAEAVSTAILNPLHDPEAIRYRQGVLQDCISNPQAVRQLYAIALEAIERQRKGFWWLSTPYLASLFSSAVNLLREFTEVLLKLRQAADRSIGGCKSEAFLDLFSMLQRELSDDYLSEVNQHLEELRFRDGILVSARLGDYLQGIDYVLRRKEKKRFWLRWRFAPSFTVAPRDEGGGRDLAKRSDRAINECTNTLAQAAHHVQNFFNMLRRELAFYMGCLNLYEQLKKIGTPVCFPEPLEGVERYRSTNGLCDVSLALETEGAVVGNSLSSVNQSLYVITGANQGGKTTFLRSIGQAQLMMQCGMFVAAKAYSSHVSTGVYSHFKREEDSDMRSGKLDEELARMSRIVDNILPGGLMLLNESFAATNEREGAEIGRQITTALVENGIEVFFVTHLFTYADTFYRRQRPDVCFLRAERLDDGERTFRITPGRPLKTGFGEDLYSKIFGTSQE